jgi:hypothetical protein
VTEADSEVATAAQACQEHFEWTGMDRDMASQLELIQHELARLASKDTMLKT